MFNFNRVLIITMFLTKVYPVILLWKILKYPFDESKRQYFRILALWPMGKRTNDSVTSFWNENSAYLYELLSICPVLHNSVYEMSHHSHPFLRFISLLAENTLFIGWTYIHNPFKPHMLANESGLMIRILTMSDRLVILT